MRWKAVKTRPEVEEKWERNKRTRGRKKVWVRGARQGGKEGGRKGEKGRG